MAVACHTGKAADVEALAARAKEAFGGVDLMVNNAATNPQFGPLLAAEEKQWDKTFDVNAKGNAPTVRSCSVRVLCLTRGSTQAPRALI